MKQRDERINRLDDLSSLVRMDSPEDVWSESRRTLGMFVPEERLARLEGVFEHTIALYGGKIPGYRQCSTGYHDLRHTTDVFLAMARLLHGMSITSYAIHHDLVEPAMAAALMHDVGYIQRADDNHGTGGKFTLAHISRSAEYAVGHLAEAGFTGTEADIVGRLVKATSLTVRFDRLGLEGPDLLTAARALYNADLLGQMADRIYLEKLLFLYREFLEANISAYKSEEDLLEKTLDFYRASWRKMLGDAEYDTQHMRAHFRERWDDDRDLYTRAVQNNMTYLKKILTEHAGGRYREHLKREGLVDRLSRLEQDD